VDRGKTTSERTPITLPRISGEEWINNNVEIKTIQKDDEILLPTKKSTERGYHEDVAKQKSKIPHIIEEIASNRPLR
jgi:hypothetical protein